jgi:cytochrome c oxidase subunit 4
MRYFMHLKFEGRWKFVLLLPTAILACGIPLALAPDIGLHYYTPSTPQARIVAPAAEHDGAAEESEHPATETEGGASSGGGGGH